MNALAGAGTFAAFGSRRCARSSVTGKGFGQTNLIAIDAAGSLLEEQEIEVLPSKGLVVLQSGSSRMSYSCNPVCMPTVQLGDDDKTFTEAGTQISTRNGYATGSTAGK